MSISLLDLTFNYENKIYEAQGQIKKGVSYKRKNDKDIEINIGQPGDEFPCIMLYYSFDSNTFKINKIRKVSWGGYEKDEPVICVKPNLPTKNSLDFLIYLSLAIIYKIIDTNIFEKEPSISINDNAFKNEYPLSWLKFWNSNMNTYGKYGFQLRNPNQKSFNFETYMNQIVPEILKLPLRDTIKNKPKFDKELNHFNIILKNNNKKIITYNSNENLEVFIRKIFDTKRREDYEKLIDILNEKYHFDIRGLWYLKKELYKNKVEIINFEIL